MSYWKTTAIAFAGAVLTLSALFWVNSATSHRGLFAASAFLLALLLIALVLSAAGGLVCLWRDARETSGKSDIFTQLANQAPEAGLLSRVGLRFLLGPALRPGDVVIVRSQGEIEATLDATGTLDGLPFMGEMAEYYGKIFRVHRRVDKINDMRNKTGRRRMRDTVTLSGLRCSGSHHDGCQAECQILWKDSWLRRLPARQASSLNREVENQSGRPVDNRESIDKNRIYVCQMTGLWEASRPMSSFDFRQDLRPLLWGNVGIRGYLIAILTQIFNKVQRLRGGADYPFMPEAKLVGETPVVNANLKAKEVVVVRSKDEIAHTLIGGKNRGLWFDPEMVRFCGRSAVVRKRVDRIIHEATRKMVVMKTPCVTLDNVVATGEYLRMCPQHDYIFWREIWLKRPGQDSTNVAASDR
ncbi:MAG TPA: hypothetical protein VK572_06665 [Burkholderiales bacterium]|nr:hypothetical protein [Burkholderiales bacterium]